MNDFDWEDDFQYCTECGEVLVDDDVSYYDMCEECGEEKPTSVKKERVE